MLVLALPTGKVWEIRDAILRDTWGEHMALRLSTELGRRHNFKGESLRRREGGVGLEGSRDISSVAAGGKAEVWGTNVGKLTDLVIGTWDSF